MLICYHGPVTQSGKAGTHTKDDNTSGGLLALVTRPLRYLLSLLPGDAPMFIYTKLLRPRPLRSVANHLLRRMIPEQLTLPEGVLLLNQNDPVVSGALSLGAYEVFFTNEFRTRLRESMTVVDIGANLGYYTLIASAHVQRVIAFEPERENATLLLRTLTQNGRSNVTLIQKGLGEKEETLSLAIHPDNKGKHTLLPIDEKGVTNVDIPVTTLDAALETLGTSKVDLIKMDIEGWEAKALRGAAKTLQASHPIIMFEYGPERIRVAGDDPLLMLNELKEEGYTLFVINEDHGALSPLEPEELIRRLPHSDAYVNILALPSGI